MNRSCLWLCTLTAATVAAVSDARAFSPHGPGVHGFARFIAGPELHGPGSGPGGPPVGTIKPPAQPPSGNYSYSGNSFNLSVTKNGRPPSAPPPIPPPSGERPGFFERLFNWW